jgi:hypothetical protein
MSPERELNRAPKRAVGPAEAGPHECCGDSCTLRQKRARFSRAG